MDRRGSGPQAMGMNVIEPRNHLTIGKADAVTSAEGKTGPADTGEAEPLPRGLRARHVVQGGGMVTRETPRQPSARSMATSRDKGEEAKWRRGVGSPHSTDAAGQCP